MPAAIAAVFSPSLRLLTFLPVLHTEEEDRWFIENVILKECAVTVAEGDEGIVAFLAREGEEVRMLYTHPDFIGAGAGSLLIEGAKRSGEAALELWCFQANTVPAASTNGTASRRSASPTAATTRKRCRTSAIAGRAIRLGRCRHP